MKIPESFEVILKANQTTYAIVLDVISSFEPIFRDNKLYFFEEYTDHGISHIESVLGASEFLICKDSFKELTSHEVSVLIMAVILHDIGMHIELSTFNALLDGDYDDSKIDILDDKTWRELWNDYLTEVKRFSSNQKRNIFGDERVYFSVPDLSNKDTLTGYHKKMIGEFIRRHHGRLAHEISINGLIGEKSRIDFGTEKLDLKTRQLAGILARSHSMELRDTFKYLEDIGHDSWRNPHNINIIFLMVVLRLADYIQIDKARVNPYLLKVKSFRSPLSYLENETHLSIISLNFNQSDPEKIYVDCVPVDSEMFVKVRNLIKDIQTEFDKSWAVLGEVYGFIPHNKPSIRFRRINSNLERKAFINKLGFWPEEVHFKVDNNLSKLLVAPLYGDNPTYGVRELLQNSIDSCVERKELEFQGGNFEFEPKIIVSIQSIDNDNSIFSIVDNGKGMSPYEIINYFLNVGTSFRKSMDWKKKFVDELGKTKINRSGKFGIGVLSSFLLGKEIQVVTRNISSSDVFSFKTEIDAQYINIQKNIHSSEIGTTISIIIDQDTRKKLLDKKREWNQTYMNWTDWYIFDDLSIIFLVDGVEVTTKKPYSDISFYEFSTSDFDKIYWKFTIGGYGYYHRNMIACNGIIISENYRPGNFNYPKLSDLPPYNNKPVYVITDLPSLVIKDSEGIFPVKLDRNGVDCDRLPFEKELLTEVSKYYIAKMLTLEVRSTELTSIKIQNAELIYCPEGYAFNFDYFIEGLKEQVTFVRIITAEKSVMHNVAKYKNCVFYLEFDRKINLTSQEANVAPNVPARILLPLKKYMSLFFNEKKKRIANYVRDSILIEEENDDFVVYNIYGYNKEPCLLDLESIDPLLLNSVESIQEIDSTFFKLRGGDIFNNLLAKYVKEEFVIPYDIRKRKQLFKFAFAELADYMKD